MIVLFSNVDRSYLGPMAHSEGSYFYLDRSARREASVIRAVMEQWFVRYPEKHRNDLSSRFKSTDNIQHRSAAFELYLHELFLQLGYAVEVHPKTTSAKSGRPDFLLRAPDGTRSYVEAVQVFDTSTEETAARQRLHVVFDTINRLKTSEWFLAVDPDSYPTHQPSARRLRETIRRWLKTLNPDHVIQEYGRAGNEALPKLPYEDGDWKVEFTAIPRTPEARNEPVDSILGLFMGEARWLNTSENIRDTLLAKGSRYGSLDAPMVIALSANVMHLDRIDVMNALFGDEQAIVRWGVSPSEICMQRARNGFWRGLTGPRYTRIAAVLVGYDVMPWSFGVRELVLYHNPWAATKVSGSICGMPQMVPADGEATWAVGQHPKDILHLPNEYPGL